MALIADRLTFGYRPQSPPVLEDVSLHLEAGQILGLVGRSGTGKSTLARLLTGLLIPARGSVTADGHQIVTRRGRMTGAVGLLHQSARTATNPRMPLSRIITEPVGFSRPARPLAERVGLTDDLLSRRPGEVSEGQLQRACVARILAADPHYLVCDEPTAMLDAAATASVATLLTELASAGRGLLVVSHDHHLLRALTDDVLDLDALTTVRR